MTAIGPSLLIILAIAIAATGCGLDNAEPEPSPTAPRELLTSLIEGQVPSALARNAAQCAYSSQAPDIWKATCSGRTFILNVRTSAVTPGDAPTKRLWDLHDSATESRDSTVVEVPTVSQRALDEAACRAAGGTMIGAECGGTTVERLACEAAGGTMAYHVCIGERR